MASTAIVNIGKLVSGDYRTGLLDADTVLIRDGKIAAFGKREDMDITGVDHVVDVKGLIVSPGLIDAHTHPVIGDWHPRHNVIGWMDGALHGGVTTIVSMGASTIQGRPSDPAGVKALAILGAKTGRNYRPGGGLKVHGGTIFLEKGLTKADFEELVREGVGVVAEIGGTGLFEYDDVKEYVDWAREVGMIVPMHFAGRSVPGSARLYADEVLAIQPDVVVHINGGPTSAPTHEAERLIDGTKAYLEVICNGNYRTMYDFVLLMKERDQLHRVLIGDHGPGDNPDRPVRLFHVRDPRRKSPRHGHRLRRRRLPAEHRQGGSRPGGGPDRHRRAPGLLRERRPRVHRVRGRPRDQDDHGGRGGDRPQGEEYHLLRRRGERRRHRSNVQNARKHAVLGHQRMTPAPTP